MSPPSRGRGLKRPHPSHAISAPWSPPSRGRGLKPYLKRYLDEDTQKDLWDIVIEFNKELQTKFISRGRSGKKTWAKALEDSRPEPEVSHSGTLDGHTGNTPSRQRHEASMASNNERVKATPQRVRSVIYRLQKRARNAAPVYVVDSFRDLPEHVKVKYRKRATLNGVRGASDGQNVWIVADAIGTVDQAAAVWAHEQGIHVGLRGLIDDDHKFNAFMDKVFAHFGEDNLQEIKAQYELDFTNIEHQREAAEEMLALIAEKYALGSGRLTDLDKSIWEEFKRWLHGVLQKSGFEVALTDEEVAWVVRDAIRWTMDGTPSVARRHPVRLSVDGSHNGAIEFLEDGRALIRIFAGADMVSPPSRGRGLKP